MKGTAQLQLHGAEMWYKSPSTLVQGEPLISVMLTAPASPFLLTAFSHHLHAADAASSNLTSCHSRLTTTIPYRLPSNCGVSAPEISAKPKRPRRQAAHSATTQRFNAFVACGYQWISNRYEKSWRWSRRPLLFAAFHF